MPVSANDQTISNAIEALTRSDIQRDKIFAIHDCSDDRLLDIAANGPVDRNCRYPAIAIGKLLRLMHAMLIGRETSESFVEKFSEQWLKLADKDSDKRLDELLDGMETFYEEIQMFCPSSTNCEESQLLDASDLLALIWRDYDRFKDLWRIAIIQCRGIKTNH